MHRRRVRAIAATLTSLSLLFGLMGTAVAVDRTDLSATALEPDGELIDAAKSRSGGLAQTDPDLLGRNDTTPVPVFIKLDYDSVASYAGGVDGLAPTSPEVTGRSLKANQAAVDAYQRHIDRQEAQAREAIESAVPQSTVLDSFQIAYGGVSAVVPANRVGELLAVDGVVAVQEDSLEQPLTDATPEFIGATEAWSQISDSTTAGEGVIVGVLDTGIWPEHPSLADNGIDHPGGTYACEFGDGSDPLLGEPFECNDKLIGAYAFTDTYMAVADALEGEFCNNVTGACSARDANGHGTHTATTAAGSAVEEAVLLGVDQGPISGIAPGAHVIAYRVCLDGGCYNSDSVAAVEQAILDGVDVINFSISGGSNPYSDAVELAFLDAYAAGILVNASAGNEGPGAATAGHGGPWTNTVGASTSDRHFLTTLELTADGGASLDIIGATVTDGIGAPTDVILAADVPGYTDPRCNTPLPADSAEGLIVACERGDIARVDKSKNVQPSGAAGMILYNPALQGLNTDNHFVPSVHIDQPDSDALLDFMDANAAVQARWDPGTKTEVPGDVMASFSSRGPLADFLKPDVTAPGVQILAGHTPVPVGEATGVVGQLYQAIAGTSMSSPHAAGVSALVKAANPGWTPGQIKSALMTSSVQDVLKEDGATPADPFDRGAGSIRADRAISPALTFDVQASAFYASAGDPLNRIHLNLPSVFADPMAGAITTKRTVRNVTGSQQVVSISTAGAGGSISVSPTTLRVGPNTSQTFAITIDGTDLPDGWHFGEITLSASGQGPNAVLPVAFNKTAGAVTLEHSCDPTDLAVGVAAACDVSATNFAPVPADVSLQVSTAAKVKQLEIANPSAPAKKRGNGFTWSGTLSPALAPTIEGLEEAPGGYFSLGGLGVPPIAGMGDETIANFPVSAFKYGSETYTTVGFTTNGYAVVGGGDAQDVDYIPQELPDSARPNNVLAPYWTDLNFGDGGEFRVAELTGGGMRWIVAEWTDVPTWESNGAVTNTFQIWITAGSEEGISFAYDEIGGADSIGLTIGAENRDGTSGAMVDAPPTTPGNDWYVITAPPTAGGSVSISYDAVARSRGTYEVVATLNSNVMASAAQAAVTITVE